MRFFEFTSQIDLVNRTFTILRNIQGRASSKGAPVSLNYSALSNILNDLNIDYETFDAVYQQNQELFEPLVSNYDGDGIELNVPGVKKEKEKSDKTSDVEKIAAQNAEKNLD